MTTKPTLYRTDSDPRYIASADLADAANVAHLLGRPLLLTGKPGCGKSSFAHSLARHFCSQPNPAPGPTEPTEAAAALTFHTRSTSTAQDLFYSYDAMRRFQDKDAGQGSSSALPYLTFGPLGLAILQGCERAQVERVLYDSAFQPTLSDPRALMQRHPQRAAISLPQPVRRVVLIDEVDKAPRDFPNDILNAIDHCEFSLPELANEREVTTLRCREDCRPLIAFTSNGEKLLPDAFLRRCIYFEIPPPDEASLQAIVWTQHPALHDHSPLITAAIRCFTAIGERAQRAPSIAELLNWLAAMQQLAQAEKGTPSLAQHGVRTLGALIKADDSAHAFARTECLKHI
jgi:MoxR-like ATPase